MDLYVLLQPLIGPKWKSWSYPCKSINIYGATLATSKFVLRLCPLFLKHGAAGSMEANQGAERTVGFGKRGGGLWDCWNKLPLFAGDHTV